MPLKIRRKDTYSILPTEILESSIHPNSKLLFSLIFSYALNNRVCVESNKLLAKKFNISERTITEYIRELRERGLIVLKESAANKRTLTVQDKLMKTFITIPTIVLVREIHPNSKLLYGIILSYCKKGKQCFESNATLGRRFNVVGRTVSKYVSELKKEGLIGLRMLNGRKRYLTSATQNSIEDSERNKIQARALAPHHLNYLAIDESYRDLVKSFIEYRQEIKKPIRSQRTLDAFIAKMHKAVYESRFEYPNFTTQELRTKIIKQCIEGGYSDIIKLKSPIRNGFRAFRPNGGSTYNNGIAKSISAPVPIRKKGKTIPLTDCLSHFKNTVNYGGKSEEEM